MALAKDLLPPTLKSYSKQPYEEILVDFDMGPVMRVERTITSVVSVAAEAVGNVAGAAAVTFGPPNVSGQIIQAQVRGGTHGEDYKISLRFVDNASDKLEADLLLKVRD